MRPQRQQRLIFVIMIALGFGVAAALVLNAFNENLVFFFTPTQVAAAEAPTGRNFRLGGLVVEGSVQREDDGLTVRFMLTDKAANVPVTYRGLLPDLFREGQGIVAMGRIGEDGRFVAEEVLAKHDENYMPPEVAEALKQSGHYRGESGGETAGAGKKL